MIIAIVTEFFTEKNSPFARLVNADGWQNHIGFGLNKQRGIIMATTKKSQKEVRLNKKAEQQPVINPVTITVSGYAASQATRVMEMLQVRSIVRIRIRTDVETTPRAATYAQMEELDSYIREQVLCRMPFPKGQGQIIYCRHDTSFSDECILTSYQAVLDAVLGKGHYHARIYRMTPTYCNE